MIFVSVTRLRLRSVWLLPRFVLWAQRCARQARRSAGNIEVQLLRDANLAFWTKTAWKDEDSMRDFMLNGTHREAMSKMTLWCDEAAVVHWTQESATLPDWLEAHRRLTTEGRPSRLRRASPAHEKFEVTPPKV